MEMNEKELHALLSFLVDSEEPTLSLAREQLRKILQNRPQLKTLVQKVRDPRIAREIELLFEEGRLDTLTEEFRKLARQGATLDLETGACLLAQSAFPEVRPEKIKRELDEMAEGFDEILDAEEPSPADAITLFRQYFADELGFHGNTKNYYEPENSYLNRVLERRTGIPIALSCVYLFLAERLDISAAGIGLPGHFIVAHGPRPKPVYVDPFHHARVLGRQDCMELVRKRGIGFQDRFLAPVSARQILERMLVNLIHLYSEQGAHERSMWLTSVLQLFEEKE
jgi:regulator of sirC expression with transglutaminase-like and TPR domain